MRMLTAPTNSLFALQDRSEALALAKHSNELRSYYNMQ